MPWKKTQITGYKLNIYDSAGDAFAQIYLEGSRPVVGELEFFQMDRSDLPAPRIHNDFIVAPFTANRLGLILKVLQTEQPLWVWWNTDAPHYGFQLRTTSEPVGEEESD